MAFGEQFAGNLAQGLANMGGAVWSYEDRLQKRALLELKMRQMEEEEAQREAALAKDKELYNTFQNNVRNAVDNRMTEDGFIYQYVDDNEKDAYRRDRIRAELANNPEYFTASPSLSDWLKANNQMEMRDVADKNYQRNLDNQLAKYDLDKQKFEFDKKKQAWREKYQTHYLELMKRKERNNVYFKGLNAKTQQNLLAAYQKGLEQLAAAKADFDSLPPVDEFSDYNDRKELEISAGKVKKFEDVVAKIERDLAAASKKDPAKQPAPEDVGLSEDDFFNQ